MLIGVDIGGTFTDLVVSAAGQLRIHKLLSTPSNPALAMLEGLAAMGAIPGSRISHGSTVATNAILERKGARTALITTQGFRDVLEIGRQNRPELYALHPQLPPPLVPRSWRYEVPERLDHRGQIIIPLDMTALDQVIAAMLGAEIEAIAVCLLYSFVNPQHEQQIKTRLLQHWQPWQISLSSAILPEFREYERTSTTVLDAYVRPVMNRYLSQLEGEIPPQSRLLVMKSDGGVISAGQIQHKAVQTALSGPAAGVIGAFHLAQLAGFDHIITLDIGGTSTDVALCPGAPLQRPETQIAGLPLRMRLIDIETVGAGGGSLVRIDTGGSLHVGPQSAGADPGPIIYGRGGQQITVSDANAVLGRLDAAHFLGGAMPLQLEPAQAAFEQLAPVAHLDPLTLALGVIEVANTHIEGAIRRVSIARGYDPREFTLVAFGGAGALHACEVAERLEITRILIPQHPGVLCALGLLCTDVTREFSRPLLQPFDRALADQLEAQFQALFQQEQAAFCAEENLDRCNFTASLDLRYLGQSYELTIPFAGSATLEHFHAAHQTRYGYALPDRGVEVVNWRMGLHGNLPKPPLIPAPLFSNDGTSAYIGEKTIPLKTGLQKILLYEREKLIPGAHLAGPALIFQTDSTIFIPPSWWARVDTYHHLILEVQP